VADLVDDGALIRARLEYAVGIGRRTPIADQEVAFVRSAEVVARTASRRRRWSCPPLSELPWACFALMERTRRMLLRRFEARVAVLRTGSNNLVLFDAESDTNELSLIR
jgi:hypothetical protein